MSTSDENEKGISELQKRLDMRLSGQAGVLDTEFELSNCFHYSYCAGRLIGILALSLR